MLVRGAGGAVGCKKQDSNDFIEVLEFDAGSEALHGPWFGRPQMR